MFLKEISSCNNNEKNLEINPIYSQFFENQRIENNSISKRNNTIITRTYN